MPHYIDIDQVRAEDMLREISRHLPVEMRWLGTPLAFTPAGLLAKDGETPVVWGIEEGNYQAWRIAELPCGCNELTRWEYGEEIGRRIVARDGEATCRHP